MWYSDEKWLFEVQDNHTIYYEIEYKNPTPTTGEIDNINFRAVLNLEHINVPEDYISGEKYNELIVNDVDVKEVPVVGEDEVYIKTGWCLADLMSGPRLLDGAFFI